MDNTALQSLIDQIQDKCSGDFTPKKLDFMLDFDAVSVMVNMSLN